MEFVNLDVLNKNNFLLGYVVELRFITQEQIFLFNLPNITRHLYGTIISSDENEHIEIIYKAGIIYIKKLTRNTTETCYYRFNDCEDFSYIKIIKKNETN